MGNQKANLTVNYLIREAKRRGISVDYLGARNILLLSRYEQNVRLFGTISERTSHLAVILADDKRATKRLLASRGLPTPQFYAVDVEDEAVNAFMALGGCVVIKPLKGSQGQGVSVGLTTEPQVREAFRLALRFSRVVLVEVYHQGRDYRIMVVDSKVVAVAERCPLRVVGDGVLSIRELITELNNDPDRGDGDEKPMTKIVIDNHIAEFLGRSNRTLLTVPNYGQAIDLRAMGSISQGSSSIDRTDTIHPEIADVVIEATQLIGLDIAGLDLIASDISLPLEYADAQIIEINCSPGIRAHLFPSEGLVRNPAANIIEYLFPNSGM
jgi:cyanophycin synthetase